MRMQKIVYYSFAMLMCIVVKCILVAVEQSNTQNIKKLIFLAGLTILFDFFEQLLFTLILCT